MIRDNSLMFTGVGSSGYAPTADQDNIAPFTYDTAPLGLPTGSGGASATGFNSGSSANAGRDLGIGGEMWLYVLVTVKATSGGSATAQFLLGTSAGATLADVAQATGVGVLVASPIIPVATLIAGYRYAVQLPLSVSYLEYIGLDIFLATATLTAGTFESGLVTNIQQSDLYLSGFAVQ